MARISSPLKQLLFAGFVLCMVGRSMQCGGLKKPDKSIPRIIEGLLKGTSKVVGLPDGRTGEYIDYTTDLDCEFGSICRWGSESSSGDNTWYKVTGTPNARAFEKITGSSIMPDGDFAVHLGVNDKKSQILMSDPIECAKGATVTFRYWVDSTSSFKVCAYAENSNNEIYCSDTVSQRRPLGPGAGIETSVNIPNQNQPFTIGFQPLSKGLIVIDDLFLLADEVKCKKDPPSTPKPGKDGCTDIVCNFNEDRNTCQWLALHSLDENANSFQVYSRNLGNIDSGVKYNEQVNGKGYLGVNFHPLDNKKPELAIAILESEEFTLDSPRLLTFDYYEATWDIEVRFELDGKKWGSPLYATPSDRQWHRASHYLPAGTHKIRIVAENFGKQHGAVGLDNFALYIPVDQTTAGENAC